jgi:hypothetical protein
MLLKKYLPGVLITISAAFVSCSGDVGGIAEGAIDDGLSSDYFIKSLSVNAPALFDEDDPNASRLNLKYDFVPGEWENELEVPYSIDIVTITAEKNHTWSSMFLGDVVSGDELTSRDPSGPINLEVGLNIIKITVTAQDSSRLQYTLRVTRHPAEHGVSLLSELSISGVTLSPVFDPASGDRSFSGTADSDYINVSAFAASAGYGAAVELIMNNDEIIDWTAIPLTGGMNVIQTVCTAGDGVTKDIYTLNIFRQQVTYTADLAALSIAGISFNEAFDKDTVSYTASVSASMNPISLAAQPESSTAAVEVSVNGNIAADLSAITLNEGNNDIIVTVTNEANGAVRDYMIAASCTTAGTNSNLKSLKVGVGTISSRPIHPGTFFRDDTYHDPASVKFTKTIYDYAAVIYGYSSIKVTAAADDPAAANVTFTAVKQGGAEAVSSQSFSAGSAVGIIDLDPGYVTDISITVTAEDGSTREYHLYAKLLNIDEFYWGIYAPSMDKSKTTWTKPQPGTYERDGYAAGHIKWVVTTSPVSTITLTGYNDGKLGYLYNDGGFIVNGAHRAELKSLTVKDGWDLTLNPPFLIKTVSGEYAAELDYHLWIDDSEPAERADSYTRIKYLGSDWHVKLYKNNKPYPFTNTYDWFSPWSDGL